VPELTLAIPYYSGFTLLERALRSTTAQSAPVRVLIVDDSPHGLDVRELEVIEALAPRARVLRNEQNLGMARSWNRCLDEADTDLVTIFHADDELTPDYAAAMIALAARAPEATAVFCGARVIGEDGEHALSLPDLYKRVLIPRHGELLTLRGDAALASLMRGNYIFCPSLCYRKSRLGTERFDPGYRFVMDMDLTVRLLLAGAILVGIPRRPLYRYRRHAANATQQLTLDLTRFREESAFYLQVAERAAKLGHLRAARVAGARRVILLNLGFCLLRDLGSRDWPALGAKLTLLRQLFAPSRGAES
jgi:GT2 family glycosyltransferase